MVNSFSKDDLRVNIYKDREAMGKAAAVNVAESILSLMGCKDEINMIFAAAPSQNEMLKYLAADERIDWARINAFHMDEYIGLPTDAPQVFSRFLSERIFMKPFKSIHLIKADAFDGDEECRRYAELLKRYPVDIVCMGIGENGHIAFNDPPVADFHDEKLFKIVELDMACRQQQVNDGCFAKLDDVPTHAITLTIPALLAAPIISCVVPAATKANAVYSTIHDEISTACPATILRAHDGAVLFLDADSASRLA